MEVPVGCVFVKKLGEEYQIIAKAHNLTNESNNVLIFTN